MAQCSRLDTKVARSPIHAPRLQSSASLLLLRAQLLPLCGATLLSIPTIQRQLTWCWHFRTFAAQRRVPCQCPLSSGSAFVIHANIHTVLEQHRPSHLPPLCATGSSYYRSAQFCPCCPLQLHSCHAQAERGQPCTACRVTGRPGSHIPHRCNENTFEMVSLITLLSLSLMLVSAFCHQVQRD